MCGRIFQTHNLQRLIQISRTSNLRNSNLHNPNFNIGPTSYIPAVRQRTLPKNNFHYSENLQKEEQILNEKEDLELDFLKWGYDAGFTFVINARIEELHEKKTFKNILNTNRCAVIVEGYYEWNEKKEPFSFKPKIGTSDYFYLAGLFFNNDTVILLTRPSTKELEGVHHRMPVLLEGKELDMWLDFKKYPFSLIIDKEILNEKNEIWNKVEFFRVGPFVNNVKNKTDKCLMSYDDYLKELDSKGIKQFFKPKAQTASTIETKDKSKEKEKEVRDYEKETIRIEKEGVKNETEAIKNKKEIRIIGGPNTLFFPTKRKEVRTEEKLKNIVSKHFKTSPRPVIQDPLINKALKDFINK